MKGGTLFDKAVWSFYLKRKGVLWRPFEEKDGISWHYAEECLYVVRDARDRRRGIERVAFVAARNPGEACRLYLAGDAEIGRAGTTGTTGTTGTKDAE